MPEADYKRPFDKDDFRGYFTWDEALTEQVGDVLYHACHENELKTILVEGRLGLRSEWSLDLPAHGRWSVPGVWCTLNFFNAGNFYGPFLLEFPLSVLNGRTFMVFRREGADRHRYFFAQYEAGIPIFEFKGELARRVKPASYFDKITTKKGQRLSLKSGAIYDIVLTAPVSLAGASLRTANHPRCIPDKCKGMDRDDAKDILRKLGKKALKEVLVKTPQYIEIIKRFPDLADEPFELPDVE